MDGGSIGVLSIVCRRSSVVRRQLLRGFVHRLSSVVGRPSSVTSGFCPSSVVGRPSSVTSGFCPSSVVGRPSSVTCPSSVLIELAFSSAQQPDNICAMHKYDQQAT